MRASTVPEPLDDLPPPPYTPHDSTTTAGTTPVLPNVAAQPVQTSLRGGYMRPSLPSELSSGEGHFTSASTYFQERQPSIPNGGMGLVLFEHDLTFFPDTTRDDIFFPAPIETYIDRDVTSRDWSTFVNYLFPVLNQSANEKMGNEKGFRPRAFVEEDTPERRQRIQNVVAEWNAKFFEPRLVRINAVFISNTSRSVPGDAASTNNGPIRPKQQDYSNPKLYRSHSISSTSSSSSSSSASSVDSIKSKDVEGADINGLRSALLAFRLDENKKDHLRQSMRQLRDEFRSQRRDLPRRDSKELRKEFKEQRKDLKREIKAIVKEARAARKADRKARKSERKSRRHGKRAETRGMDRTARAEHRAQRKLERAEEQVSRAQERAREARERAAIEAHGRNRETHTSRASNSASACERGVTDAQPAQPRDTNHPAQAVPGGPRNIHYANASHEKARLAEHQAREDAAAAVQQAQETARTYSQRDYSAAGDAAVARAQETAQHHQSRNYGADAVARAQETPRYHQSRNYGADAVARAQETAQYHQSRNYGADAVARAQETARSAGRRDWGREGRERAREAEERARERVEAVTKGL